MAGGTHGRGVMCSRGVCMAGGVHSGGHVWQGACMARMPLCGQNDRQM